MLASVCFDGGMIRIFLSCCLMGLANSRAHAALNSFTVALNQEIAALSAKGGGRVTVPPGRHESGLIELKSNVELHLALGCEIVGSSSFDDYPLMRGGPTRSQKDVNGWTALVFASGATNIAVTGFGAIDGRGDCQRANGRFGGKGFDTDGRARNILFVSCRGVTVRDITLRNPAMWTQHYFDCEDVVIENVRVFARVNYNNDGLDLDSCRRVVVRNCTIESADDAIVFKATSTNPCEDVEVENCSLSSQATAIKFGTESVGSFRRFKIRNVKIRPSPIPMSWAHPVGMTNGIAAVEISTVDGGDVEDIDIDGVDAVGCASTLFLRVGNRSRPVPPHEKGLPPGFMRNVRIANVRAREIGNLGSSVSTFEEGRIKGVSLENISIETVGGINEGEYRSEAKFRDKVPGFPSPLLFGILPAKGLFQRNAKDVSVKNFSFTSKSSDVRPEYCISQGLNR